MRGYGYTFAANGCLHGDMLGAAPAAQRANGVEGTGSIGPKTWAAVWTGKRPR